MLSKTDMEIIKNVLIMVRHDLEEKYQTEDLQGKCVEASEAIVSILQALGYKNAKIVEGWCHYDDASGCSNRDYDEHTWVELEGWYLDATADQFNHFIDKPFEKIVISETLPYCIDYESPETSGKNYSS